MRLLKDRVKEKAVASYTGLFSGEMIQEDQFATIARKALDDVAQREKLNISDAEKKSLVEEIVTECVGFGVIDKLLRDPSVSEIMINGLRSVYIERHGKKILSDITFTNEQQIMQLIFKFTSPTRRRIDESSPFTDVALNDGSRVNVIIPPLAIDGPTITIRKYLKDIANMDDLINMGTVTRRMADFLIACVRAKVNIIFSGATGSGKTTTLNALSTYIDADERIITIEDTAELRLSQKHVVRLETKPASIEGKGEVKIGDLFKNSLRMRPTRIVIGEIRGDETLDMLQAISSGHRGSLAVIHGSTPADVLNRMEMMILTSGIPITMEVIHRQIVASVHIIVQQEQLTDGRRRITYISQINGLKDGKAQVEDLYRFDIIKVEENGKVHGKWVTTGIKPCFGKIFDKAGIVVPDELFQPQEIGEQV